MVPSGASPPISYFKRYRMEIALEEAPPPAPLPAGYFWVAWDPSLLEQHADIKYRSFNEEIDSLVFPNLASREGCLYLMQEIAKRPGFKPEATWLIGCPDGYCGTVQGIRERNGLGAIQNVGVLPLYRGQGLGQALVLKALEGFRRAGLGRAYLEVTACNESALRIYRRLGFRCRKTLYKAVDLAESVAAYADRWLAYSI